MSSNVSVSVRIRSMPMSTTVPRPSAATKEDPAQAVIHAPESAVTVVDNTIVIFSHHQHNKNAPHNLMYDLPRDRQFSFTFDHIFDSSKHLQAAALPTHSEEEDIFRVVGKPCAKLALEGVNSCIFAFGHTGSGKTYTIVGLGETNVPNSAGVSTSAAFSDVRGIAPRMVEELLDLRRDIIHRTSEAASSNNSIINSILTVDDNGKTPKSKAATVTGLCATTIDFQVLEIYNEEISCLLSKNHKKCVIREGRDGPFVEGSLVMPVRDAESTTATLRHALGLRKVFATSQNVRSTRSHVVIVFRTVRKFFDPILEKIQVLTSRMHIVDLAGSEKIGKLSKSVHDPSFEEGVNINRSLLTLGTVIEALTQNAGGESHHTTHAVPPYRDSKLTFLIKDALGGDSVTHMVATINPSSECFFESYHTLQYADRAKKIRNHAVVHCVADAHAKLVHQQRSEIDLLKTQLRETCDLLMQRQDSYYARDPLLFSPPRAGGEALFTPMRDGGGEATGVKQYQAGTNRRSVDRTQQRGIRMDCGEDFQLESHAVPQFYLLLLAPCPIAETPILAFALPHTVGSHRLVLACNGTTAPPGAADSNASLLDGHIRLHTPALRNSDVFLLGTITAGSPHASGNTQGTSPRGVALGEVIDETGTPQTGTVTSPTVAASSQPLLQYLTPSYVIVPPSTPPSKEHFFRMEVDGVSVKDATHLRENSLVHIHFAATMHVFRFVRSQCNGGDLHNRRGSASLAGASTFARASASLPRRLVSPWRGQLVMNSPTSQIKSEQINSGKKTLLFVAASANEMGTADDSYSAALNFGDDDAAMARDVISTLKSMTSPLFASNTSTYWDCISSKSQAIDAIATIHTFAYGSNSAYSSHKVEDNRAVDGIRSAEVARTTAIQMMRSSLLHRGTWYLLWRETSKDPNGASFQTADEVGAFHCPLQLEPTVGAPYLPDFSRRAEASIAQLRLVLTHFSAHHAKSSDIISTELDENTLAELSIDVTQYLSRFNAAVSSVDPMPRSINKTASGVPAAAPIICRGGARHDQYMCLMPCSLLLLQQTGLSPAIPLEITFADWNAVVSFNMLLSTTSTFCPTSAEDGSSAAPEGQAGDVTTVVDETANSMVMLREVITLNCRIFKQQDAFLRKQKGEEDDESQTDSVNPTISALHTHSFGFSSERVVSYMARCSQQNIIFSLLQSSEEKQRIHDAICDDLNDRIRFLLEDHSTMRFEADRAEFAAEQHLRTVSLLEEALCRRDGSLTEQKEEVGVLKGRLAKEALHSVELKHTLHQLRMDIKSGMYSTPSSEVTEHHTPTRSGRNSSTNTSAASIISTTSANNHNASSPARSGNARPSSARTAALEFELGALQEELASRNRSLVHLQSRFAPVKKECEENAIALRNALTELEDLRCRLHDQAATLRNDTATKNALQVELESTKLQNDHLLERAEASNKQRAAAQTVIASAPAHVQQQKLLAISQENALIRREQENRKIAMAQKDTTILDLQTEVRRMKQYIDSFTGAARK